MLADIAQANANANEANNTLKGYLEQKEAIKPSVYRTPLIISGVMFLAGLYIWSSRPDPALRRTPPHPGHMSHNLTLCVNGNHKLMMTCMKFNLTRCKIYLH